MLFLLGELVELLNAVSPRLSSDDDDEKKDEKNLASSYSKVPTQHGKDEISFVDQLRGASQNLLSSLSFDSDAANALRELLENDTCSELGPQRNWSKSESEIDFLECCEMYGKIIVSELGQRRKTIRENTLLGGIAGGAKYLHAGLLFKLGGQKRKKKKIDPSFSFPYQLGFQVLKLLVMS